MRACAGVPTRAKIRTNVNACARVCVCVCQCACVRSRARVFSVRACLRACVCLRVHACARLIAIFRSFVRACVHACVRAVSDTASPVRSVPRIRERIGISPVSFWPLGPPTPPAKDAHERVTVVVPRLSAARTVRTCLGFSRPPG